MLRLRQEVGGAVLRTGRVIGDDDDLARPVKPVDADGAEDAALGRCHVGIAGPDDLVHLRNGLRTVGQRGPRLRAADGEDPVDACQAGCREHQRVLLAARRGHHHDQLIDARYLGRQRVHQHRTRIGRLAAGHVQADAVQRRDLLPEPGTVGLGEAPGFELLPLVIGRHALRRRFEGRSLGGRQAVQRMAQLAPWQFEFGDGGDIEMIETKRVLEHRRIAFGAHALENFGDDLFDGIVGRVIEVQQFVEGRGKTGVGAGETANHRIAPSMAAMTGCNTSRFTLSAA